MIKFIIGYISGVATLVVFSALYVSGIHSRAEEAIERAIYSKEGEKGGSEGISESGQAD